MALTNRQFDEISREFDRKRTKALREQEERTEQVRKQIPELAPIEEKIISLYAARARFKLDGQTGEAEELSRKIAALRGEKQRLLAEAGIPEDYDELKSECPFCGDTGFVDGEKCSCFKQAEIRLLTMEAIVLLLSSSALLPPMGASSIVSAFSLSRLLAISSFSLKVSSLPRIAAPSRRVTSISFIVLIQFSSLPILSMCSRP